MDLTHRGIGWRRCRDLVPDQRPTGGPAADQGAYWATHCAVPASRRANRCGSARCGK
jgi:hypothetical protein